MTVQIERDAGVNGAQGGLSRIARSGNRRSKRAALAVRFVLATALLTLAGPGRALNKTANYGFDDAAEPGTSWVVGGTVGANITATETRSTTSPQEGTYSLQAQYSTTRAGRAFSRTFTQTYTPTADVNAQLRGYYKRIVSGTAATGYSVTIALKNAGGTVLATAATTTTATNDTAWQGGAWTTSVGLTAGATYTIELAVAGTLPATTSIAGAYFDNIQLQVSPEGLTPSVVADTTNVSLSWSSTNGPNGPNLRATNPYQLYRGTASGAETALTLVSGSPYTNTSTTGNTTYWYQITDFDSSATAIESPRSVEASVLTLPGAPTMATYGSVTATSVVVNWTAPTGGAASYKVERSSTSGSAGFTEVATGVTGTTWPDSGPLSPSTQYWYRVRGTNTSGDGAYASATSVTTATPVAPSSPGTPQYSSITATGYTVTWTASATGTTPITYTLQSSADGATGWAPVTGCSGAGLLTCSVTSASNTLTYYRVNASNGGGNATSGVTSQLTLPGQPTMATYTGVGQTAVTVNWTMAGTTTGLTYAVQRGGSASGPWTTVPGCGAVAAPATSCGDSGLTANTTYWYQVQATNTAGPGAWATSTSVTTNGAPVAPSAPGTPSYANVAAASLTVNWGLSASGTAPITYALQWSATGSAPWNAVAGCSGVDLGTCNVTGLTGNTTYHYQVVATNSAGSATSSSSSQLTRPGQPAAPTFGTTTTTSIPVTWAAPTGPTGGLTFILDRAKDSGFTQELVSTPGLTGTSTTASGLTPSTTYYFRVAAVNATGAGQPSAPASTATQAVVAGTTVGTGTDPDPVTIAPGDPAAAVDAFTLQTDSGSDAVASATVKLSTGTWVGLSAVSIQNTATCTQATPYGSMPPSSDTVVVPLTGVTATASLSNLWVCVTPKPHAAMPAPPGAAYGVTATVTAIASTNAKTYADSASGTITVDNKSPANVRWGALSTGDGQVVLNWANPADTDYQQVVILRSAAPITVAPAEGATYAQDDTLAGGAVSVRYAGSLLTFTDSGLTNGTGYYYKAFAKDARGNYALGVAAGPAYPGTNPLPVGSSDPARPVVAIMNPGNGMIVSGAFRVQVRVWSPADPIQAVQLTSNEGASWSDLGKSTNYNPTATSGMWETTLPLGAATYRLVARAHNSAPGCDPTGQVTPGVPADDCVWVNSAPVRITVQDASSGDGRLMVRDDSSQLCADCHAHKTHSSESVGTDKGAWATVCRDCHTPHGTTNIYLVPTQITPPPRGSNVPAARDVVFLSKTGAVDASGSGTPTGVCQVCHQQTDYYKADGTGASHYTGDCASCHKHTDGLKASCTDCHGTKDRAANVAGADSNIASAPPDLAHEPTDPLKTPTATGAVPNGVHLAHLDKLDFRAAPLQCAACHLTNQHKDGNADVAWGEVATGKGTFSPTPATGPVGAGFSTTPTCTTWCHGNGLAGNGRGLTWSWNGAGPLACNSCHGQSSVAMPAQAAAHHPQNPTCANCHGVDYTVGDRTNHINGTVEHATGCTACHGQLSGLGGTPVASGSAKAAPGYDGSSVDTKGNTARTFVGVGAHGKHVSGGTMMSPKCGECHQIPGDGDVAHANSAYGWSWTATEGVTPSYAAPSCTNYCHSNARPLGQPAATTVPMAWTSTTALGCTDCHANTAGAAAALSSRHGKHLDYGYACDECHAPTMQDNSSTVIGTVGNHVNGVKNVGFSTTALDVGIAQQGGEYQGTVGTPAYTCASTYCHSDGTRMFAPFVAPVGTALSWLDGTTSAKCDNCHGGNASADQVLATGSHAAHVNEAGYLGTNLGCVTCHANTVNDDRTIGTPANHVNGVHDVSAGGWDGTSTCATSYCHSNGTENPAAGDYKPVTWGVTALADDCKGCHGTEAGSVGGAPWYANDTGSFKTRNTHQKHVTAATDCVDCHDQTVTPAGALVASGTMHLNQTRDVHGAKIGGYDEPSETCSAVACHGGNDAQWGGTLTCANCHVGTGDLNDWSIANDVTSRIDSSEWENFGHGQSYAAFSGTTNRCVYCHDDTSASAKHGQSGNPFRLRGAANASGATAPYSVANEQAVVAVCLNCHAVTGANGVDPDGVGGQPKVGPATARIDALHHGAKHGATNGGQRCWDCHDAHGDQGNIKMISRDVLANATDVHGLTGSRPATEAIFVTTAVGGYTDQTAPTYNGVCQVCHTTTKFWHADGTLPHNETQDCVSCHSHEQPPDLAFQGAGACSACHLSPSGGHQDTDDYVYNNLTKAVVDRDEWATYGHGATANYPQSNNPGAAFPVTDTVEGCYYCHAPDTAIVGGNGSTSSHDDPTNPFRLSNTGGADGKNGVCLVCHKTGSAGYDPDGAGSVFADARPASKKIDAAHFGAQHAANGKGGEFCWDCHDPHGDYNYTAGNRALAYMIQEQPVRTHVAADPNGWGIPDKTTELANAVAFDKQVGGDAAAIDGPDYTSVGTPTHGVCQVCHTATTQQLADGTKAGHQIGARCTLCHAHDQGTTDAFKQATACADCHAAVPSTGEHAFHVGASTPAYGDIEPHSVTGAYAFGCGKCHSTLQSNHANDVGGTAADPYQVDVAFDWTSGATPYTAGTASNDTGPTGLVFRTTTGTCATYCHSNGTPVGGTPAYAAPTWNAAGTTGCTDCHGSATVNVATMSSRHAKHVQPTASNGYNYQCNVCHAATVSSSSQLSDRSKHVDGQKQVAITAPGTGTYDNGSFTCASVYCHSDGTPLGGSTTYVTGLRWDTGTVNGVCTSCHGGDASSGTDLVTNKHPQHVKNPVLGTNYGCVDCHATVVSDNRTISDRTLHVNGTKQVSFPARGGQASAGYVSPSCNSNYCHSNGRDPSAVDAQRYANVAWNQVLTLDCTGCHGRGSAIGAPNYPDGATLAEANTHDQHTSSGADGASCQKCHYGLVNATGTAVLGSSHTNGVRDVVIAPAYDNNGATANYDPLTKTCTSVSCHGTKSPVWGTTLGCNGCHGNTGTARTPVAGADANLEASPPIGLGGETLATQRAVGAHLPHVNQLSLRSTAIVCAECHNGATHNDTKEIAWGTLATTGGRFPGWTGTNCSATYCHAPGGAELGGSNRSPSWTGGSPEAACGTCHRSPPPVDATIADHPQNTSCAACHGTGYATGGVSAPALSTHVNGSTAPGVDKPANGCTACHGVLAGVSGAAVLATSMTSAPGYVGATTGVDTSGASAVSVPSVGAHDAHVRPSGSLGAVNPIDCSVCHVKPVDGNTAHADGTIAIGWTSPANAGGITPTPPVFGATFEASPSCTNYCHSNATPLNGTPATPSFSWTSTANMLCSSCHATSAFGGTNLSQAHGKHLTGYTFTCDECHSSTMQDNSNTAFSNLGNHVNGTKDWQFSTTATAASINQSTGSYSRAPNYTCTATYCHSGGVSTTSGSFSATASAAVGWNGTATCRSCHGWDAAAAPTIGVATGSLFQGSPNHGPHVNALATYGQNYVCADCHVSVVGSGNSPITTPTLHVNGQKNVSIATRGSFTSTEPYTSQTCSATYCHSTGQATPTYKPIVWTAGAISCNGCHGTEPSAVAGAPWYTSGTAGTPTANSHPEHVTAATDCQKCHSGYVTAAGTAIPAGTTHTDGSRQVAILGTYDSNGATINYTQGSKTCDAVTCHSNASPLNGTPQSKSVIWGDQLTCTGCHSNRGADQGGALTDLSAKHGKHLNQYTYTCDECHASTMQDNSSAVIADRSLHANGTKNWQFSTTALTASINQSTGSYAGAGGTCTGTYCHSGGVSTTSGSFSATASAALSWNGTATCRSCHGWDKAAAPTIGVATGSLFQGSANHAGHVANDAGLGTSYACGDCHATVVAAGTNSPITAGGLSLHVNGQKNVSIGPRGTITSTEPYTGQSCSATYCHSNGRDQAATDATRFKTISWTATGTILCNACHGTESGAIAGAPWYPDGSTLATANSHASHVTSAADCQNCHVSTVTAAGTAILGSSTLHTNGVRNVTFLAAYSNGGTATYDNTTKKCSAVSCHGAGTPIWGDPTTATCTSCHGTTGTESEELGANFWVSNTAATINTNQWAWSGHGRPTASGNYEVTGNPAANFLATPTAGTSECLFCHDNSVDHKLGTNPFRLRGASTDATGVTGAWSTSDPNAVCLNCHEGGSFGVTPTGQTNKNGTLKPNMAHDGSKHTGYSTLGGKFCWDCHEPHGDRPSGSTNAAGENVAMIRSAVIAVNDGTYGYTPVAGSTRNVTFNSEAATAPATGKAVEITTAVGTQHVGVCQACHGLTTETNWTKYWNRNGQDDPDGPGGNAPTNSTATATPHNGNSTSTPYCISCHKHTSKFAGGGPDCRSCHGTTTAGSSPARRAVDADFADGTTPAFRSHHVGNGTANTLDGTLTNNDCYVCHAEAVSPSAGTWDTGPLHANGVIDLRDADSATTYYQYDKDAVSTSAGAVANWGSGNQVWREEMSGQLDDVVNSTNVKACNPTGTGCKKGLDRFCISCHDADGASGLASFWESGATALNPFNDTNGITNNYDQQPRGRVVDVASRVHDTARKADGTSFTAMDRDPYISFNATGSAPRRAATPAKNDPPEGVFSRHAVRGLSTSVYNTTNANLDGTTTVYWNRATVSWNSTSLMGCADCHTVDGANGTSGNAHGSSSEYLLKSATGTAAEGTTTATVVCSRCHPQYTSGTSAPTGHLGSNGSDWTWSVTAVGAARYATAYNVYGYACGNCHGGGGGGIQPSIGNTASKAGVNWNTGNAATAGTTGVGGFGTIHGTSQVFGIGTNGGAANQAYRATYRFTNGNSMKFYNPGTNWTGGTGTQQCYTLGSAVDTGWGGCTKHSGGVNASPTMVRPLAY